MSADIFHQLTITPPYLIGVNKTPDGDYITPVINKKFVELANEYTDLIIIIGSHQFLENIRKVRSGEYYIYKSCMSPPKVHNFVAWMRMQENNRYDRSVGDYRMYSESTNNVFVINDIAYEANLIKQKNRLSRQMTC
jgi:hypothetical protein